jgi:diguanylate cyclase (GGDEF)-like protein
VLPSTPLILVCDHRGAGLAERLASLETAGLRVVVTRSLRESRRAAALERPGLVVLDPLVEGGAAETMGVLEALPKGSVPLLLVADHERLDPALDTLKQLDGDSVDLLHRRATGAETRLRIERLLDSSRRQADVERLRQAAFYDERTGLLRPRAFHERLLQHLSAALRHRHELAFVLLDLDKFGQINKRYDHVVGDKVISKVGEAIRHALRTEDVPGRLGGDEFAVVLPYTSKVDAAHVVVRLRDRIRGVTGRIDGVPDDVLVSTSIGFESYDPGQPCSPETLRAHAEMALREAKRLGGDRGVYYRSLVRG